MNTSQRQKCLAWIVAAAVIVPVSVQGILVATAQITKRRAAPPRFTEKERKLFFSDARTKLVGERPAYVESVAPVTTAKPPTGATGAMPAATGNEPAAGKFPWSKLISAETLVDEVKVYAPLLAAEIKSPSHFKGGGMKNARRYFSTLAATFAIIAEYDREVRWKAQAATARDLFGRAGLNSKTGTDQAFNESKLREQDLTALVRGETLQGSSTTENNLMWNSFANRPPLMWRLERAQQDRIAVWTASQQAFSKNKAQLIHESQMVAALAEVIQKEGYPESSDEGYRAYAQSMQQGAREIISGAASDNLSKVQSGAATMSKACNDCHGDFRS
ncbi:MAG: hypothetical protein SGJ20_20915 [Planctomycetota bacterium]|nr:hypothetical protein [Planctomycetota bacterium]